jgi:hypothetical protein
MHIEVEQDDWGEVYIGNIQRVLEDVAEQLTRGFPSPPDAEIRVRHRPTGVSPIILLRSSRSDPYRIELTPRGQYWFPYIYEFAHEFCHILCNYETLRLGPNEWFHESLCELASIFTLKQLAVKWQDHPPYQDWERLATPLEQYANGIIARDFLSVPSHLNFGDWFQITEPILRRDPRQRHLNGVVVLHLLPLFQENPEHWQSVGYMPNARDTFAELLSQWWSICPNDHRPFVSRVLRLFAPILRLPDYRRSASKSNNGSSPHQQQ